MSHSSLTKDIEVGMPQSGRGEGKRSDFSRKEGFENDEPC
jgi:hypothetical protein